jgi:hypothetical protein
MRSAFQKQRCTARIVLMILFAAFLFIAPGPNASAGTILGTDLSAFAILGGAGVTVASTGSVITGSVGGCCGAVSVTGYPAGFTDSGGTVYDTSYSGSLPASTETAAQTELGTAMTALLGMASSAIPEASLNNITLGPGVYSVSATDFNGTLTLDGGGNVDALWVFLFASSLTTAGSSNVIVENTGAAAGVYWVLGTGSATLGSSSTFVGNILANAAVSVGTTATDSCGRLLTQTASVTLDGAGTIGIGCSGVPAESNGLSGGGTLAIVNGAPVIVPLAPSYVPEPSAFICLAPCLAGLMVQRKRSRSNPVKSRA